jgi:hypothetical protein
MNGRLLHVNVVMYVVEKLFLLLFRDLLKKTSKTDIIYWIQNK